jgi:hypothetical protein
MRGQDGFISTHLHASLSPEARFRFVNVAVWRSVGHFQRAVSSQEFADISHRMPFAHFPAVYRTAMEFGEIADPRSSFSSASAGC